MIKATEKDKELVVTILSESFKNNQSITYVAKQDAKVAYRIKKLMEYSFNVGMACGEVFISKDHKSCAILLYSEKKLPILKSLKYDIDLALNCIGITRIPKVMKREKHVKSKHPQEKFMHLWYIGVSPKYQSQNIGSELMGDILDFTKKLDRKIYLETSTLKNIPFYERLDFKIFHTIKNLGYDLFMLHN